MSAFQQECPPSQPALPDTSVSTTSMGNKDVSENLGVCRNTRSATRTSKKTTEKQIVQRSDEGNLCCGTEQGKNDPISSNDDKLQVCSPVEFLIRRKDLVNDRHRTSMRSTTEGLLPH
jgi:hypothetical protein